MAWTTPKLDWTIASGVSTDDLNRIEGNIAHLVGYSGLYGVTTGSASAYLASIPGITALTEGVKVTLKLHIANGATPSLNINGLGAYALRKSNGNAVPAANLKVNSIYTFVFSGSAFILQGEGGGGTAQPDNVLAPFTFTNEDGEQIGTVPTITSGSDPALGVGQWPDGGLAVYPARGYRKGGAGEGEIKVTPAQLQSAEADLRGPYILSGHNIYGTEGAIPNRSAQNIHMPSNNSTAWVGDRIFLQPPDGWYDGSTWVTAPAPYLQPINLREGTSILGVGGTMVERGKQVGSGGWQVMQSTVDTPWVINIGYRPQVVFYQYFIRAGVVHSGGNYSLDDYWGYGILSKSMNGEYNQSQQGDNGYTPGPRGSFMYGGLGEPIDNRTGAISWSSAEGFGSAGNYISLGNGQITATGFTLNFGVRFRDPRGSNIGWLNWMCI
jgi:hypothetical protein